MKRKLLRQPQANPMGAVDLPQFCRSSVEHFIILACIIKNHPICYLKPKIRSCRPRVLAIVRTVHILPDGDYELGDRGGWVLDVACKCYNSAYYAKSAGAFVAIAYYASALLLFKLKMKGHKLL